ncbi:hypothetical protein AGMMS49938_14320 [Fibrobacterales bacterium]|nr:hypothetical protein AGMMS49938_14320 [Fibrobacterales bacterium]
MASFDWLKNNPYPGRGVVQGVSPSGDFVQVYWIMGRSENSRNRIFLQNDDGSVRTRAFDEAKVSDPSLIIYFPYRKVKKSHLLKKNEFTHIVTNGDQTDTIAEFLGKGKSAEEALKTRTYEPDQPNFTPRISGVYYPNGAYALSIIKNENGRSAFFIERESGIKGTGEMLTTYEGDSDPLVSFIGLPKQTEIFATPTETLNAYWDSLNPAFRVSILVNWINPQNGENEIFIKNGNL